MMQAAKPHDIGLPSGLPPLLRDQGFTFSTSHYPNYPNSGYPNSSLARMPQQIMPHPSLPPLGYSNDQESSAGSHSQDRSRSMGRFLKGKRSQERSQKRGLHWEIIEHEETKLALEQLRSALTEAQKQVLNLTEEKAQATQFSQAQLSCLLQNIHMLESQHRTVVDKLEEEIKKLKAQVEEEKELQTIMMKKVSICSIMVGGDILALDYYVCRLHVPCFLMSFQSPVPMWHCFASIEDARIDFFADDRMLQLECKVLFHFEQDSKNPWHVLNLLQDPDEKNQDRKNQISAAILRFFRQACFVAHVHKELEHVASLLVAFVQRPQDFLPLLASYESVEWCDQWAFFSSQYGTRRLACDAMAVQQQPPSSQGSNSQCSSAHFTFQIEEKQKDVSGFVHEVKLREEKRKDLIIEAFFAVEKTGTELEKTVLKQEPKEQEKDDKSKEQEKDKEKGEEDEEKEGEKNKTKEKEKAKHKHGKRTATADFTFKRKTRECAVQVFETQNGARIPEEEIQEKSQKTQRLHHLVFSHLP